MTYGQSTESTDSTFFIFFDKKEITVQRKTTEDVYLEIPVKARNTDKKSIKDVSLEIVPDQNSSTLSAPFYQILYPKTSFAALKLTNNIIIRFSADSIEDADRTLELAIQTGMDRHNKINSGSGEYKAVTIKVKGAKKESIDDYRYLAYIGTNFDLVDGIKTNNLFFATNIFVPRYTEAVGFAVSLYGNRTFTATDTTGTSNFISKRIGHGDSAWIFNSKGLATRTRTSDNLGAVVQPLIPLWKLSLKNTPIQLYYAPHFEFIWRRTHITTEIKNPVFLDSSYNASDEPFYGTVEASLKATKSFNIYDVHYAILGFMVVHETKDISVRLNVAGGYNKTYFPSGSDNYLNSLYSSRDDMSFIGRLWITEPVSGITFQAEVINYSNFPNPYYGVTFSKALRLKHVSSIFQPITTR